MMPRTRNRGAHAATHRAPRSGPPRPRPPARGSRARGAGDGDRQVGGSKLAALPRATVGKIAAGVVVVGVIVAGLVQGGGTSAEPTVQAFLLAWENGQYQTAAALTTGSPHAVTAALAGAYRQLDAADLVLQISSISQHGEHGHRAVPGLRRPGQRRPALVVPRLVRDAPDRLRLEGACGARRSSCPACGRATGWPC